MSLLINLVKTRSYISVSANSFVMDHNLKGYPIAESANGNAISEYTFLCSSQRIRRYGSLNDTSNSKPKFSNVIVHKVTPKDTLQSLELCYNSSMFEIKRLNKLWSDQSLYCKSEVLIPVYDDGNAKSSNQSRQNRQTDHALSSASNEYSNDESVDQLFKRIDLDMKQTKKSIKKLKKSGTTIKQIEE